MDRLYVVFMRNVPIGVHQWPWMALNEAKERSIEGVKATVASYKFNYTLDPDFIDEETTNPDCVPCSHDIPCDDAWKTNKSGAV